MIVKTGGVEPIDLVALKAQPMQYPEFFVGGAGVECLPGFIQAGAPAFGVEDFGFDLGYWFDVIGIEKEGPQIHWGTRGRCSVVIRLRLSNQLFHQPG